MIPKFIYLAPLSKKIYKLTQIEKISDLPFCPVVPKITKKKKIYNFECKVTIQGPNPTGMGFWPKEPETMNF